MADQQPPRPERDAQNQPWSDVPEPSSGEGLPDWIAQLRDPESPAQPAEPRQSAGPSPAPPGQYDGTGRHAVPPRPPAPNRPGDQPGPEARGGWQPAPLAGGWEPTAGGWEQPRPAAPLVQRPDPNHQPHHNQYPNHQQHPQQPQQPDQRHQPDQRPPNQQPQHQQPHQPPRHQPGPPPGGQHQPGGWERPGGWAQPAPGQRYPIPPSAPPEEPLPPRGQVPPPQHAPRGPAPQPHHAQYPPQYPAQAPHEPPPFTPAPQQGQPRYDPPAAGTTYPPQAPVDEQPVHLPPAPTEQEAPAGASGWPPPEPPPWTEPVPSAEWAPPADPANEQPTDQQPEDQQPTDEQPANDEQPTDDAPVDESQSAAATEPEPQPEPEPEATHEPEAAEVETPEVDGPEPEPAPDVDQTSDSEPTVNNPQAVDSAVDIAAYPQAEDPNQDAEPVDDVPAAGTDHDLPDQPVEYPPPPAEHRPARYPQEPNDGDPEPAQYSRSQYSAQPEPQRQQYFRQPQAEPDAADAGWGPAPEADQGWDDPAQDTPAHDTPAQDAATQDAATQDAAAQDDWDQSVAQGWDDPEPTPTQDAPALDAPTPDTPPDEPAPHQQAEPVASSWEQPRQPDYGWDDSPQQEQGWEQPQQDAPQYPQAPAAQYPQETQYAPPAEPAQPQYAAPTPYPAQGYDAPQHPQEQYAQPDQYAQPEQHPQQHAQQYAQPQYPQQAQYQQPAQQPPPNNYQPEQPNHPVGYNIPSTGYQPGGMQPPHQQAGRLSTADDLTSTNLLKQRGEVPTHGWRKAVFKVSAGTVNLGPSKAEQEQASIFSRIRTTIRGCHRIAVVSLKGGIGKTTTTSCLGLTLAHYRGDRVVALDANPDAGTLAERLTGNVDLTVRDLLDHIDRIQTFTEVSAYTTLAGRLQVLASDQDPEVSQAFGDKEYRQVCSLLARFYNVVLTDSGTGLLHSAMAGTLAMADSLVVVSAPSVDGASRAAKTLDWLIAHGYGELVSRSVAVISSVRPMTGEVDMSVLRNHFGARCRRVIDIPYDPHLVTGGLIDITQLKPATKNAYLELAATVADDFASTRPGRF